MNGVNQYVSLSSGFHMPLVGFGTFRIRGAEIIYKVIEESLKAGFRSIDTAAVYRNEEDIGNALKKLLPKYKLQRKDIFITTKLNPTDNGKPEQIQNAIIKSLQSLDVTYIDLYLIHWPGAAGIPENSDKNRYLRAVTWNTLIRFQKQGILRSIGVSNFTIRHIEQLMEDCQGITPDVNQVECHPYFKQEELRKFCNSKNIHIQAYSSLGTSDQNSSFHLLKDSIVNKIASKLDVSPARLLLKWSLQQGIGIIPKATKQEHIQDNKKLNFIISKSDMILLNNLPQFKYAWNPSNVN